MERKLSDIEAEINKVNRKLKNKGDPTIEKSEQFTKYQELVRRDQEMKTYLNSFDEVRHQAMNLNKDLETKISDTIESIAISTKKLNIALPTEDGYKNLKGELVNKEKEMTYSTNTMEALIQERDKRLNDLEKVEVLESKLDVELNSLRAKIEHTLESIEQINDIDAVRHRSDSFKIVSIP